MINSVLVTGAYGDSIELMLWDESNGYIVEEIEGLGPVDANIVSTNYASFDGSQFQSARRSPRNIIFKIGFATKHPTFSAEELRRRLSNIFRTKSQVSMLFRSDKNYLINGYVETNEPSIFSKDPKADISIMCLDPDFLSENPIIGQMDWASTVYDSFINYQGTEPTGMEFSLKISNLTGANITVLKNHTYLGKQSMSFIGFPYTVLGFFTTNTNIGRRAVYYSGDSVLYALQTGSQWIQLYPGMNNFAVNGTFTGSAVVLNYSYNERYGSI